MKMSDPCSWKVFEESIQKLQGKCKFIINEGGDVQQVGIIMYLPTSDEEQREVITKRFFEYRRAAQLQLWDSFGAHEHWAKIEVTLFSLIFPCASIFYSKLEFLSPIHIGLVDILAQPYSHGDFSHYTLFKEGKWA